MLEYPIQVKRAVVLLQNVLPVILKNPQETRIYKYFIKLCETLSNFKDDGVRWV